MNTVLYIVRICSVIGLLDTSYLIYHKWKGTEVACLFFPKAWCYEVQHSRQSKTFGVPNSYLGFLMYALLLGLSFVSSPIALTLLKVVIVFGFGFSMYFLYVQKFVLRAFCTWCVLSAVNFTVLFVAQFFL